MDDVRTSEHRPVYHADDLDTSPYDAETLAELLAGGPPRLFMLVQEFDDEDERVFHEIMAYGIALPNGSATIVGAGDSRFIGRFGSAGAASRRFHSELVWLTPAH